VRELGIQAFRSYWGRMGLSVPANWWAKVKTVVQEVAVGLALLPVFEDELWVADSVLWTAVVLTVLTGVQYVIDGRRCTRSGGSLA
jgi:CDP-diacylglycerol--glycerol-3-phosphate 3-phosphatidyltransferase